MVLGASSIRLVEQSGTFRLETATVRLRLQPRDAGRPFYVSLVSTVHLADEAYYASLQSECEGYDRVLFE